MRKIYDQIFYLGFGALVVMGLWLLALLLGVAGCSTLCRGCDEKGRRVGGFEITRERRNEEGKAVVENAIEIPLGF